MTIKYPAAPKAARGRPRLAIPERERDRLYRLYVVEEKSTREVAAAMRIGEAAVRRRLRAAGIEARPSVKRSGLRRVDQARLFSDVILLGTAGAAKRYKVTKRALQYYLAGLRKAAGSKKSK